MEMASTPSTSERKYRISFSGPRTPLTLAREINPVDFLAVPRHRRLQSLAVAIWACMIPICFAVFFIL
ncbi:hypothetical protein FRC03_005008, partial [Tulasnella sp. 419]